MNTGVSMAPCGVVSTPRRAARSRWETVNENIGLGLGPWGLRVWYGHTPRAPRLKPACYYPYVKKLRVGVIYGGRSGEHEVSVASAASVMKHLDRTRYEPVPIRIEKDGRWTLADKAPTVIKAADVIEHARVQAARPARPRSEER